MRDCKGLRYGHASHTSQNVVTEINLGDRVAKIAHIRRKTKPLVVSQLNGAFLHKLPAKKQEGDFTCVQRKERHI